MKKVVLKKLELIIQGEVLYKKEIRDFYSVDASSYQIIPKVIVIPKNEIDVINTIKIAKKYGTSVTVRGSGTGLVGSALNDGIILDLKKFGSIIIGKNHVTVGVGVPKGKLDKKLERVGKYFPPNPSIGNFCSIGGMLGNNSSGSRSLKYGSMVDNVSEITLIDGNGEKIILQKNKKYGKKIQEIVEIDESNIPKTTKNSSGYRIDKVKTIQDSHKIIIGSEGTLGVIVSAKLRIKDDPKKRLLFIIEYTSIFDAAKNSIQINDTTPSALEFVDENTLKQIKINFSKKTKCLLFVEYDEDIKRSEIKLKSIISGKIILRTGKKAEMSKWWRYRDSALHYSLRSIPKEKRVPHVIEDAAVPLENVPELFSFLNKIEEKFKVKSIMYGHMGNGNIHIRLVSNRKKIKSIKIIADEFFYRVIKMNGTISAEHGDGLARSEFVKQQYREKNYQTFKKIKKLMDPKKILNPGKIITKKSKMMKNLEKFD